MYIQQQSMNEVQILVISEKKKHFSHEPWFSQIQARITQKMNKTDSCFFSCSTFNIYIPHVVALTRHFAHTFS